ncbi:MAG: hypothetical protein ACLQGP_04835 [Isosphaeraceae bacterium]
MIRRKILILVGLLVLLLAIGVLMRWRGSRAAGPRPPELGGQRVPDAVFDIRFDRQYDLFCSFFGDEPTVYRNCKILGFTGREEPSEGVGTSGFGVFSGPSGSGSAYSYREFFDHWLVLKLEDGRLAYVPPGSVKYIEEASPKSR